MVEYTITVVIDVDEGDVKRAKEKAIDLIAHNHYKSIDAKEKHPKIIKTSFKSTKKKKGGF